MIRRDYILFILFVSVSSLLMYWLIKYGNTPQVTTNDNDFWWTWFVTNNFNTW